MRSFCTFAAAALAVAGLFLMATGPWLYGGALLFFSFEHACAACWLLETEPELAEPIVDEEATEIG